MSRILLVDDSPHAQRMGERILSDEGYEVVTVSNADAALVRLEDVDPDVVLADTVMPGRTGYDICQYVKLNPRHRHVRVILTAGVLEPLDDAHTKRVEADATLRKPFEASALLSTVRPLADAAEKARGERPGGASGTPGPVQPAGSPESSQIAPFIAVVDSEQVRAAVTVALDAAMGTMVEEITRRVLSTLNKKKPDARVLESMTAAAVAGLQKSAGVHNTAPPATSAAPQAALPPPAMPRIESVRRVNPLRLRSTSILGLDISHPVPHEFHEPADAAPSGAENKSESSLENPAPED
jgi:CheY-like chemotaxis protein